MENRVEILRGFIDALIANKERGKYWYKEGHLHAVSCFTAMYAIKRNLDSELAVMIGLLHDIHTLLADDSTNHAELSSLKARDILSSLKIVSDEELEIVCNAIKNHSSKDIIHDEYSELIKDADLSNNYFFNPSVPHVERGNARLEKLFDELDLK